MSQKNLYFSTFFIGICLLLLLPIAAGAQSISQTRAALEQQRNRLQKDIQRASQNLKEVKSNRHRTLTQMRVLQNKLHLRNKLIKNLNQEIAYINDDIHKANNNIHSLQTQLDTLRAEYAKMVVYAYKNQNTYNVLNFILSANSFNDAIKRFEYLKQYRAYREHEAKNIIQTQAQLRKKLDTLKTMKSQRGTALTAAQGQRKNVISEKSQKDSIAQTLKGHEKELMASIEAKEKESQKVSSKINAVIRQQIEEARKRAAEEARQRAIANARKQALAEAEAHKNEKESTEEPEKQTAPSVPSMEPSSRPINILEATPAAKALSESFEANRGKLPWPVSRAIVVGTFGVHHDAVLEKIMVDNDGITLQTNKGAVVKAVFKGEVVAVSQISGRWLVVIRHGQYFTVYSNLQAATVQRGDHVGTLQPIGLVFTNRATGEADLDFKIYKSKQSVDPLNWLASR